MKASRLLIAVLFLIAVTAATASAYEYSVTNIEDYTWLSDLTPYGTQIADKVKYWLGNAGWTLEFYHKDSEVKKEDFGTSDSSWEGLDEADFHWHTGHGLWNNYDLALYDYSPWKRC